VGDDPFVEFDDAYMSRLHAARHHWWVEGMLTIGQRVLAERRHDLRILDLGCGTGAGIDLLRGLAGDGLLHGSDISAPALGFCRAQDPTISFTQASAGALPYRNRCFDLVVSHDVLQHLPGALAASALREVSRVLAVDGRFLVRTNASFGRARVDEHSDWRLYRPETLRRELEASGLVVERLTYANSLPALAVALRRLASGARRPRGRAHPDHGQHGDHREHEESHDTATDAHHGLGIPVADDGVRSAVARRALRLEAWWLSRPGRSLPFGHSLIAVARKPARASVA
jgi:SAM-dependent methyltransferase